MLKTLLHCMLISTAVFAADHSDPFSSPTASSSKSERVILSEDSGEPSPKKQRIELEFKSLRHELITHIATFARIKDGIQMSSTCKNWKQALDQSDIWQHYASRLAGYEFFEDAPCFKQENGLIDYRKIIKAATYPFIFIFKKKFRAEEIQRDGSSLLGNISPEDINIIFNPVLNEKEGIRSAVPYTFHSASPYYSPSSTQTVIKNYQKEFGNNQRICFHYDIHQGTLEFIEAPDDEQGTTSLKFISKNREMIIGTDDDMQEPIHIWIGQEGRREYHSIKGYPNKILQNGEYILGQHNDQAHIWFLGFPYILEPLNNGQESRAHDINRKNTTIIVGQATDGAANNEWRAVKWTNGIIQSLGTLNGGNSSKAIAISTNGDIIIGNATDGAANNQDRAVKWTNGDIQPLDVLAERNSSKAYGMSADGQVIVGESWQQFMIKFQTRYLRIGAEDRTAVRWTSKGIESLTSLLKNILPPTTKLNKAFAVDERGSNIQGHTLREEPLTVLPHEIKGETDLLTEAPRNADGSLILGNVYSWKTYLAEQSKAKEKELTGAEYINSEGNRVWGNPSRSNIILKEVTLTRNIIERYLAFVPREDILEKEGLRAHF